MDGDTEDFCFRMSVSNLFTISSNVILSSLLTAGEWGVGVGGWQNHTGRSALTHSFTKKEGISAIGKTQVRSSLSNIFFLKVLLKQLHCLKERRWAFLVLSVQSIECCLSTLLSSGRSMVLRYPQVKILNISEKLRHEPLVLVALPTNVICFALVYRTRTRRWSCETTITLKKTQKTSNLQRGSRKFLGHFEWCFALTLTCDFLVGDYHFYFIVI